MKWITRLEARFGRFALPNVTLVLILGQVVAFMALSVRGVEAIARLTLVRDAVLQGEVWRLVTFVFLPPATNLLFAFIAWYLFYLMGTALEHHWGVFRYNIYLLIGVLAAIAAGMLVPGIRAVGGDAIGRSGYLAGSVFLAFAFLYPNFVINLFFILPIRIKWLALITWVLLGYRLLRGDWAERAMVVAAVLNFLIFFGGELLTIVQNKRRRAAFESRVKTAAQPGKPRHSCTVCGVTNLDDPKMQFRYCSQCEGQLCYCMDHLRDHEHVASQDHAGVTDGQNTR